MALTERDLLLYAMRREENLRALRRAAQSYITTYDKVEEIKANPERLLDRVLPAMLEDKRQALASVSEYERNNINSTLEKANRRKR